MNSNNSTYTGFKFEMDGFPALAIINSDLKKLEQRFDYGYSVFIEIIPDVYNEDGHPEDAEFEYLLEIEKKIIEYLESETSTLHVGHITQYRKREIIFYTKKPEPVNDFLNYFLPTIEREHSFEIEPDKEWEQVAGFYEQL
jgi:hypothetical protein